MTRRAGRSPSRDVPLYAAPSRRHGRGVFAGRRFRQGEVLERCPILRVSARDRMVLEGTALHTYLYERGRGAAIALGFGSLLNHSFEPNAAWELLPEDDTAVFRALRAIEPGEEITICYADESELWFHPRDNGDRVLARNGSSGRRDEKRRSRRSQSDDLIVQLEHGHAARHGCNAIEERDRGRTS